MSSYYFWLGRDADPAHWQDEYEKAKAYLLEHHLSAPRATPIIKPRGPSVSWLVV